MRDHRQNEEYGNSTQLRSHPRMSRGMVWEDMILDLGDELAPHLPSIWEEIQSERGQRQILWSWSKSATIWVTFFAYNRRRRSGSALRPHTRSKLASRTSSLLRAKHSMMSLTRLRIGQTGELTQRNTRCGKFIRQWRCTLINKRT